MFRVIDHLSAETTDHHVGIEEAALVRRALGEPAEPARVPIYARIQEMIDREALVIPLFAPCRIVMAHAGQGLPKVDIDLYRTDLRPCLGPDSVKQATR